MHEVTEDDFIFLSFHEAIAPSAEGYYRLYREYWWSVNPEKGIAFYNPINARTGRRKHGLPYQYRSPQCNLDGAIAEHLRPAGCSEVRKIDRVWVPVRSTVIGD